MATQREGQTIQKLAQVRRELVIAPRQRKRRQIFQTQETGRVMARQLALPPTLAPRLVGRNAAAAYVSVAPNTFDTMVREGRMPKPRILSPGRKAWDIRLLDQAIDGLPLDGEDTATENDGWDD